MATNSLCKWQHIQHFALVNFQDPDITDTNGKYHVQVTVYMISRHHGIVKMQFTYQVNVLQIICP